MKKEEIEFIIKTCSLSSHSEEKMFGLLKRLTEPDITEEELVKMISDAQSFNSNYESGLSGGGWYTASDDNEMKTEYYHHRKAGKRAIHCLYSIAPEKFRTERVCEAMKNFGWSEVALQLYQSRSVSQFPKGLVEIITSFKKINYDEFIYDDANEVPEYLQSIPTEKIDKSVVALAVTKCDSNCLGKLVEHIPEKYGTTKLFAEMIDRCDWDLWRLYLALPAKSAFRTSKLLERAWQKCPQRDAIDFCKKSVVPGRYRKHCAKLIAEKYFDDCAYPWSNNGETSLVDHLIKELLPVKISLKVAVIQNVHEKQPEVAELLRCAWSISKLRLLFSS